MDRKLFLRELLTNATAKTQYHNQTDPSSSNVPLTSGHLRKLAPFRLPLLIGLAYLSLSLAITWPLALHLTDSVPGQPFADQHQNLWNFWWAGFSLFKLHTNPFQTNYLYYPTGSDLYLHALDLTNGLLSVPFQWLGGLVLAYNVVNLFGLTLTGWATWWLASRLIGPGWGAFVAGFLMTFVPAHLNFINGQPEFAALGWLILYAALLHRLLEKPFGWRYGLAGGLLLTLMGYTSQYQVVFAAILSLIFWLGRGAQSLAARKTGSKPAFGWRAFGFNWLLGWVILTVTYLPLTLGSLNQLETGPTEVLDGLDYITDAALDPTDFIINRDRTTVLGRLLGNQSRNFLPWENFFLSYSLLALAAVGLGFYLLARFRGWSGRSRLGIWLVVGVCFGVLSLGPELKLGDTRTGILLPYRLLLDLPFGRVVRNTPRFSVLLVLALALLAGYGFQQLLARWPRRRPALYLFTLGWAIIFAVELWPLPYPLRQVEIPAGYYQIKDQGAVLDLPFVDKRDKSGAMYYQTAHHQPIARGYLARYFDDIYTQDSQLLAALQLLQPDPDIFEPAFNTPGGQGLLDWLRIQGFGTVVLHRDNLPEQSEKAQAYLSGILGPPYLQSGPLVLYSVPTLPPRHAVVSRSKGSWLALENSPDGSQARWMSAEADFNIWLPQANEAVRLELVAVAFARPRNLKIMIEEQEVGMLTVPEKQQTLSLSNLKLKAGLNRVHLVAVEPPDSPEDLGKGKDPRKLSVQLRQVRVS